MGHIATYDLDTKCVYVSGGVKEGTHHSSICILDTATWKWLPMAVSNGAFPGEEKSVGMVGRSC